MRLLAHRIWFESGYRVVGVTNATDNGVCYSLWLDKHGAVEVLGHRDAEVCDEYVAGRFDGWVAAGGSLDNPPVVVEEIDLPPRTRHGTGEQDRRWAEHVMAAAETMFATRRRTIPAPYLQKLTMDAMFISPSQDFLDILTGGAL